ncbi:MAG: Maf family protein [Planctomycetota bacterium]|nr:Maf family protein [Planctomycetota bacterium]
MREFRLILASSSPRRRELLAEAGLEFEVVEPPLAEPATGLEGLAPAAQAESSAYFKARAVGPREGAYVLGADTIVAAGPAVMGKPADAAAARAMLANLSGTRHEVITGVALLGPGGWRRIASATTVVVMRTITPEEVAQYVASGEWEGKAGGYAIQETADRFVDRVEGSFSNIVGLPVELVLQWIDEIRGQEGR